MTNAIFLLDNFFNSAEIEVSSELATAPASYLQDTRVSKYWSSESGEATSWVKATLLSTFATDWLAVVNANLTSTGTIRVRAWDDALDGAVLVVDMTQSPTIYDNPAYPAVPYGGIYGGLYGAKPDYSPINENNVTLFELPAGVTAQYWRYDFTDPSVDFYTVGAVVMSTAFQAAINLDYDNDISYEERSTSQSSLGGQLYTQVRPNKGVISGNFTFLSDAERTAVLLALRRFGEWRPMVFSLYPENTTRGLTSTLYGRISTAKTGGRFHNLNAFRFTVTQEL